MLDRSERLTEQAPCWYLRYARLDDATALLRNAFIETDRGFSGPARKQQSVPAPAAENVAPASETPRPGAPGRGVSDERFVRRPDAFVRQGRGEFFLGKETGDEIFHLNPLGRAVWELLAEPLSEAEGVELLASVFPQTPRAQIERDVMNLFTAFQRETLIFPLRKH